MTAENISMSTTPALLHKMVTSIVSLASTPMSANCTTAQRRKSAKTASLAVTTVSVCGVLAGHLLTDSSPVILAVRMAAVRTVSAAAAIPAMLVTKPVRNVAIVRAMVADALTSPMSAMTYGE